MDSSDAVDVTGLVDGFDVLRVLTASGLFRFVCSSAQCRGDEIVL